MVNESKLHRALYKVVKNNSTVLILALVPMLIFLAFTWRTASSTNEGVETTLEETVTEKKWWQFDWAGSSTNCDFGDSWPGCRWKN